MKEPIWKKLGFETDMEYYKFSYAGKKGEVIKRFSRMLGKNHPFYVIKRPIDPLYGKQRYEYKIYDSYHDGYIEKEVFIEDPEEPFPTINEWFNRHNRGASHFKEYVRFCVDTNKY